MLCNGECGDYNFEIYCYNCNSKFCKDCSNDFTKCKTCDTKLCCKCQDCTFGICNKCAPKYNDEFKQEMSYELSDLLLDDSFDISNRSRVFLSRLIKH